MNTGVQRSSATPPAARTANTKPVGPEPGNVFGQGKSAPLIAMAHEIPYVATATVADLHDLERKIERAMEMRGARYVHVLVPCPLGWGSASKDTIRIARLAWETGSFRCSRPSTGRGGRRREVPPAGAGRGVPARPEAVRAPLLRPAAHRRDRSGAGARRPERPPLRPAGGGGDGEAVRDHTRRRLEPRQQDGHWRTERPIYVHRLPPCADACPAGENVQQWLYDAEEGGAGYERAWRQIMEDNPFPAVMGRVCYHPCETVCNRAQLDEAVGINAVERFLGDEAIAKGWRVEVTAPPSGKRVLVVGAGPPASPRRTTSPASGTR